MPRLEAFTLVLDQTIPCPSCSEPIKALVVEPQTFIEQGFVCLRVRCPECDHYFTARRDADSI